MLNKVLATIFIGLIVGKFFFRPQLRALGRWLDGVINAFLLAIVIVYSIQLVVFLLTR